MYFIRHFISRRQKRSFNKAAYCINNFISLKISNTKLEATLTQQTTTQALFNLKRDDAADIKIETVDEAVDEDSNFFLQTVIARRSLKDLPARLLISPSTHLLAVTQKLTAGAFSNCPFRVSFSNWLHRSYDHQAEIILVEKSLRRVDFSFAAGNQNNYLNQRFSVVTLMTCSHNYYVAVIYYSWRDK